MMNNSLQSPALGSHADSQPPRKRQARSDNGCGNCKKRKIKCDERTPGCARCQTRRLTCPGYSKDKYKWSYKHEIYKPDSQPIVAGHELSPLPHQPYQPIEGKVNELESYETIESPGGGSTVYALSSPHRPSTSGSDGAITSPYVAGILANGRGEVSAESRTVCTTSEPLQLLEATAGDPTVGRRGDPKHSQQLSPGGCYNLPLSLPTLHEIVEDSPPSTCSNTESLALSPNSAPSPRMEHGVALSVPSSLLHIPTILVEHYFQRVCRDCSTFDSTHNPFRTMVSEMRMKSATLNYTIQSLAAAKLVDDLPSMRVAGIEAQGLALESLRQDCSAAGALDQTSDAVLCTILLLGMTTSWHFPDDLGLEYLALARRIITAKAKAQNEESNLEFYQNALMYWTMIVSIVSGETDSLDITAQSHVFNVAPSQSLLPAKKIMPHPWTGVSPVPQELFGETLRLIRRTRSARSRATPTYSRASIKDMFAAIEAAETLETRCWTASIPSVDQLSEFGDPDTPRVHHVLTAKGYLLSSLLQLYTIFPDILDSRINTLAVEDTVRPGLVEESKTSSNVLSTTYLWPHRHAGDPHSLWLRDIGIRLVECLEQIDVKSGTRVVHPPLLLTVATALTLPRDQERVTGGTCSWEADNMVVLAHRIPFVSPETPHKLDSRVQHCRAFIINRLETMHALMRFRAIHNVLTVVKEVWRRADADCSNIFWMDVMHELRCETLFG